MAVLAECPFCHEKRAARHKLSICGADLDKAKRSKKVRYWIRCRLPDGRRRKEFVGTSIEEARYADGKRKVQKRENRIFDVLPQAKMTFGELVDWYVELKSVQRLSICGRIKISLTNLNKMFRTQIVNTLKIEDLENY
jgi:hypothetical protein